MERDAYSLNDLTEEPDLKKDAAPSLQSFDKSGQLKQAGSAGSAPYWEVLLAELVHLIGLFFVHCKHAQGVRTTEVLFDQVVRHLAILMKMPDRDEGILIRRCQCAADTLNPVPDYLAMCGNLMIRAKTDPKPNTNKPSKRSAHLQSALLQAFQCFSDLGIHSLYLQMPGNSTKKIDQLRLALNIVARFPQSADSGSSIRFRCYGRAMTFPLIKDADGRDDPNLTLMAALNGLSPVNTRELVRQAEAFHKLGPRPYGDQGPSANISSYNQIFSVRSLRSQIVKPPVEVNNLPWQHLDSTLAKTPCGADAIAITDAQDAAVDKPMILKPAAEGTSKMRREPDTSRIRRLISGSADIEDHHIKAALDALEEIDYGALNTMSVGQRLVSITHLLYALDKQSRDPTTLEYVIDHFQDLLKSVPDPVLSNIIIQRQGLKIVDGERSILIGLVHPRLHDVITLISEHVSARRRSAIIKDIAFNFDPCHITELSNGFGISEHDAYRILETLKECFNATGSFIRPVFEGRIDTLSKYGNAIFEILWCFLKQTPRSTDRLNFLNALQLLMAKLSNAKQAVQFLLADICQTPAVVSFTDRNGFSLTNILLHQENKELYVDISRTPEDVLDRRRKINAEVKTYLAWRLNVDQTRLLTKLRTIHRTVQKTLHLADAQSSPFELSFLLALEREALILLAIVGGHTARTFLRELLRNYAETDSKVYQPGIATSSLSELMSQLQIVIRAVGCAGTMEDIAYLKTVGGMKKSLLDLNPHPAHALRVHNLMKWIPAAIEMVQAKG